MAAPRVALRDWTEADRAPLAAMNADPEVMRHFPAPLTRAESDAFLDRLLAHRAAHGFTFRAVEADGAFAGLCGLLRVGFAAPFAPAVEIGWRLLPAFQGRGLAMAAARLALAEGFGPLGLDRIVAFTTPGNARSLRLMERLGMTRRGTFPHPGTPPGQPPLELVWTAIERKDWQGAT